MARILTSYLNHPLVVDPPPGVLRVQVSRQVFGFQQKRIDLDLSAAAPTNLMSEAVMLRLPGMYMEWLMKQDRSAWLDEIEQTAQARDASTALLLCHEASPMRCHRAILWWALHEEKWSLDHELASKHGGQAKLEGLDADC
jgi:hypothetical protein